MCFPSPSSDLSSFSFMCFLAALLSGAIAVSFYNRVFTVLSCSSTDSYPAIPPPLHTRTHGLYIATAEEKSYIFKLNSVSLFRLSFFFPPFFWDVIGYPPRLREAS